MYHSAIGVRAGYHGPNPVSYTHLDVYKRQVEIAHEALLRAWPRLRAWLDDDRATLRLARQLTQATAEWQQAQRSEGFLLRGSRLDLLAPLAKAAIALTEEERQFLSLIHI